MQLQLPVRRHFVAALAGTSLLAGALLMLDAVQGGPRVASAGWPRPHLGGEVASVRFTPHVDYLGFREGVPESGIPDRPEARLLEGGNTDFRGFSLGLALHPDLDLVWTRHTGDTQLRYFVDGVERFDGQLTDGVITRLPRFDYTLQTFSARWSPGVLRWRDRVGPAVGLGWGSVKQDQAGDLNLEGRLVQWGDTDKVVEMMVGAELRAPWVRAGVDLRLHRWRFEPDAATIPVETVYARALIGWVRLAF